MTTTQWLAKRFPLDPAARHAAGDVLGSAGPPFAPASQHGIDARAVWASFNDRLAAAPPAPVAQPERVPLDVATRMSVAWHESGHGLVAAHLWGADRVQALVLEPADEPSSNGYCRVAFPD